MFPRRTSSHNKSCIPPRRNLTPYLVSIMSQSEIRPGLADVPVAESAVSFIDGQRARLEYRGIPAETLARESNFEESTWLLLEAGLRSQKELIGVHDPLVHHRRSPDRLKD